MAMTKLEYIAKQQIMKILLKSGYKTYASLLDKFDINLTSDPNVVGYMVPNKAKIVLNKGLDIDQVSVIVRHEILHEYLSHALRMERHVGKDKWDKRTQAQHNLSNIAADYEISNRGYTEHDKAIARAIKLNDKVLQGLVTEDEHPDWVDMTMEQMYDELLKEKEKDKDIQPPDIGNPGDSEIQEAEEIQRQAEAISDDAGQMKDQEQGQSSEDNSDKGDSENSEGSGQEGEDSEDQDSEQDDQEQDSEASSSSSGDQEPDGSQDSLKSAANKVQQKADELADDAEELQDTIEQNENDPEETGEVFRDKEDLAIDKAIEARLNDLKRILQDVQVASELLSETEEIVNRDKAVQAAKDAEKYRNSPLSRFKESLNNFIKNEIAASREKTWSRVNKTYAHSGIIKKGVARKENFNIPRINVYFDQSGSWDDEKIKVGEQAVGTLNNYVRRGELKIDLYYFSENVHSNSADARDEGGTRGEPILEHIKQTKPDNVIIMTDSDISDCVSYVTVPGGVWFLFKGGYSSNLVQHLKGKKLTRSFEI